MQFLVSMPGLVCVCTLAFYQTEQCDNLSKFMAAICNNTPFTLE